MRQVRSPDGSLHLAPRTFEHPILASLREVAGTVPWDAFPVFRYWQLGELAAGASAVIPLNDYGPALLERTVGRGRALTMTTPISDNPNRDPWNLLPAGDSAWPFFLLSREMAAWLVGSSDQQLNFYAGQPVVLQLNPKMPFNSYVLPQPDGVESRVTPNTDDHTLAAGATDLPGNYRVQAGGEDSGVDRGFSVNATPEQTRLERLSEEDLKKVLDPLPFHLAQSRDQIELNTSAGRVGRELFPFVILAVAVVLALEHVVANRFYRE